MRLVLLISLLSYFYLFAQTETGIWKKKEISYLKESDIRQRDYTFYSENPAGYIREGLTKAYWFLISDVDGNNCPFRPSCSEFFNEAVSQTNIFSGTLLFFDRFTRDLNFISRKTHYSRTPDGHFYDPPERYIF